MWVELTLGGARGWREERRSIEESRVAPQREGESFAL